MNETTSQETAPAKVIATVVLVRTKECRGSVRFDTKDPLAPVSNVYLNRSVPFCNTAKTVKVTIEEVP